MVGEIYSLGVGKVNWCGREGKGGRVLIDQDTTDKRANNCRAALDLDGSLRLRSEQAPTRPHTVLAGAEVTVYASTPANPALVAAT